MRELMSSSQRVTQLFLIALVVIASSAGAHTLFFKANSFYVPPGKDVIIPLFNGTFLENENKVTIARFADARIISPDGASIPIRDEQWFIDDSNLTSLVARFEKPGNYVVALGTKPMKTRMTAEDFNFYLKYEGLLDDMKERNRLGEQGVAAAETYSKFTKAIFQAGEIESNNFDEAVGHPIEIVPLTNPFTLEVGASLVIRVLKDSIPLAGALVYASDEESYVMNSEESFEEPVAVRTDKDGLAEVPIQNSGRWYVRVIDLSRISDSEHWYSGILVALGVEEPRIAFESLWATLTFEVR